MRFIGTSFIAFGLLFCGLVTAAIAQESVTLNHARAAYEEMDEWLGDNENGDGWRKFLNDAELKKQLDLGRDADPKKVEAILALYRDNAAGLSLRHFTAMRRALAMWAIELETPSEKKLHDMAEKAGFDARPIQDYRLNQARQQTAGTVQMFEAFLRQGGPAREKGWRNFLQIDELKEQLASDDPNLDKLTQIWALFAGDTPGLDHPRFAAVRETLREYIATAYFFENEKTDFSRLPNLLKAYQDSPGQDTASEFGSLLGWLERSNQGEGFRKAVAYHYARPNLLIQASEKLVVAGFGDSIDREREINTFQNGQVTGTETTKAEVTAKLVRNLRRGEVQVSMVGTTETDTTRQANGVTVKSTAKTETEATKPIYFTTEGMIGGEARANATTDITLGEITASVPQLQEQAAQQVAANEERDEQQAARRAEAQTAAELNTNVTKSLSDANDQLQNDVLMPLIRRGAQPRRLDYTSTEDYLTATVVQATQDELAADTAPPAAGDRGDLIARMHESWLNNVGSARFRGVLLTDEGLAKWLEEERGEVPADLQVGPDTDPWDLTFDSRKPLAFEVTPKSLKVTLRGIEFTARDREMNESMYVIATYKVAKADGRAKLVRDGDLEIEFPEQAGKKLSVRYIAMKRFWATKFKSLFEEEITELPIELEGQWADAGDLEWTDIKLGDDWATVTWDLVEKEKEEAAGEETADEEAAENESPEGSEEAPATEDEGSANEEE